MTQWIWRRHKDNEKGQELLRVIKEELQECKKRLDIHEVKTVPTYKWQLAVHTGRATLLSQDELSKISAIYFSLDNYTYEARLCRRFSDDARQAGTHDFPAKQSLWIAQSEAMRGMEKGCSNAIQNLLKERFWPMEDSQSDDQDARRAMPSPKLERTVIQASVLLITLLFVVANFSNAPEVAAAWFAYIAAIFVVSVITATLVMFDETDGEVGDSIPRKFFRMVEAASFIMGLVILFGVFYNWSLQIPENKYAVLYVCGTAFGIAILFIIGELVKKRRGRDEDKRPDSADG